jgi:uncharacterized protein YecE (DUF72 family)
MEFGRITPEELEHVNFSLPPDHPETGRILAKSKKKNAAQIFVGCAKWGRKDWVGTIYPEKTKEADFLEHYSRHFNSIELNATFYKIPTKAQTTTWSKKVGSDFVFCPKFSQSITHIRRLKNAAEVVNRFVDGISGFGRNLGPAFLMPHPQMGPKTAEAMQQFLEELPDDLNVFMELRHPEWFTDVDAYNGICKAMERKKTGAVITDASGRRDCVHMRLTSPEVFIRFVGNGLHPTDYTRVDEWVQRIREWNEKGLQKVYFFMHQHEEIYSPQLAAYVIRELNKHCGTSLEEPKFVQAKTA